MKILVRPQTLPGAVTYTDVVCPTCGATIRVGYQALAPEYLIAQVQCPYCGRVVATDAVSATAIAGPTVAAYETSGIDISSVMSLMISMMVVVMMMKMMAGVTKAI